MSPALKNQLYSEYLAVCQGVKVSIEVISGPKLTTAPSSIDIKDSTELHCKALNITELNYKALNSTERQGSKQQKTALQGSKQY